MNIRAKEKKERALGVKLFLKAERCNSPKCAMVRRPYKPGMHGKKRQRAISEYGQQLMEKQRIRFTYGLKEAQMENVFKRALKKKGSLSEAIVALLERRLDNVVFRLGFAPSRIMARQFVSHGHILVNGRKVNVPSFLVKGGDAVSIKPSSAKSLIFKDLSNTIKKYQAPDWLMLDTDKVEGKVKSAPLNVEMPFDINLMVEYYSK